MNHPKIEAIIFDLGGVILSVDYQRTVQSFHELGFSEFGHLYSQKEQSALFDDFETGRITPNEFIARLQTLVPCANSQDLIDAWNSIIGDFPTGRLAFIESIRTSFRVFLLSNTNAIHTDFFNQVLVQAGGSASIHHHFDKAYLSHEINLRKPDESVFRFVLQEQNLIPERTLFIDDSVQHINAARSVGLHTIHLNSIYNLENELMDFLAKFD